MRYLLPPGGGSGVPEGWQFTTPEAVLLAESHLIVRDLEGCRHNVKTIQALYPTLEESPENQATAEALFRDTLVQFIGCFGAKEPHLSAQTVFGPVEGGLGAFQLMQDLRDTYAAHRFGPSRQAFVVVVLTEDGQSYGFAPVRFALSLPEPTAFLGYLEAIDLAINAAKSKVEAYMPVVGAQLQSLGEDGLKGLVPFKFRSPRRDELRLSRSGFRSGSKGRGQGPKD